MKNLLLLPLLLFAGLLSAPLRASLPLQTPDERLLKGTWPARWICDGASSPFDYGIYRFRKTFTLKDKPERFVVSISADNRYRLYVNGTEACWGPARGDLNRWYYETVDIAPLLEAGENVLAVTVWNMGALGPGAQIGLQSGLIVQGDTPSEEIVNSDGSWRVLRDEAYAPLFDFPEAGYIGAQDRIDGRRYPWGWERPGFDDGAWNAASGFSQGKTYGAWGYGETDRILTPRDIPMMEETPQRLRSVRRYEGLTEMTDFLSGTAPLRIPAGTRCSILLDQGHLTTAYPRLTVSGGEGSRIRVTYAEALFDERGKGDRNETEGRTVRGFADEFIPDGQADRTFAPLWFKTYRYVLLDIETTGEPLTVEDFYGIYTGYPFEERGSFASDDPSLDGIWRTGWHTARLCAHETYFDCPYYEQLQYAGDTRIQALISLYVSGDDRLVRKAIRMFDLSRSFEGITASRYPSHKPQYIPPFSLYWIAMVHDYWMHRDDDAFVAEFLPGIRSVVEWFERHIDPQTGMLRSGMPHWNFTDWAEGWERGVAPESPSSGPAVTTLHFASALRDAAELMERFGKKNEAKDYASLSRRLTASVYENCWDPRRGLLRDCIGGGTYSQHANIMGILTDAIPPKDQRRVFETITGDPSVTRTTFYYTFYLIRALKKTGLADRYVDMLGPWQRMIDIGLSTFAETPEPTRSDCHAWSSSPNYDLLATVCGIEPSAPGFASVRIAPHPGRLNRIRGTVPHPQGLIAVELERDGKRIRGRVELPGHLGGTFVWNGRSARLRPGTNAIDM